MAPARKTSGIIMTPDQETENLSAVVAMLNDFRGREFDWDGTRRYGAVDAVKLRRLATAWTETLDDPDRLSTDIQRMKLSRKDRDDLERFTKQIKVRVGLDGALVLVDYEPHPWDEAALQFTRLLRNPQRIRLGGPCRGRTRGEDCGKWFLKKTARQAIFCCRKCAGNAAKAYERKRIREQMLKRAKKAIEDYPTRANCWRDLNWKDYAVKAKYRLSKKFLTQAVNRGWLAPPESRRVIKVR
jgi:hypothetical protein